MDEIDKKIIEILSKNSRTSFTEIAKRLNLSEAAIRKRVKKLESEGVIIGYSLLIDFKKAKKSAAIIGIDTEPEDFINILCDLKKEKEENNYLYEIYSSTGDHMIMIKVIFDDKEELNKYIENIKKKKGVKKVCPSILLDSY
jgi:Lrp/AsnC family transcriptional regulator for asnA, asnC and gidA